MYDPHKLLVKFQKLIGQLQSDNPDKRYDACVELRVSPYIPDEAIEALREATLDPNLDVAMAAQRALDFHSSESRTPQIDTTSTEGILTQAEDVTKMYKSIRSWTIWLVVWGGISIVAGGTLDPVWGIVLIVVAVMSWRIRIPAMFVIYSGLLASAAVKNSMAAITGAGTWWFAGALFQVFLSFITIREFRKYRKLPLQEIYEEGNWPVDLSPPKNEFKITGRFAIASLILAIISVVLMSCAVFGGFMVAVEALTTEGFYPQYQFMTWLELGAVDIAWLAVGLGIAAVLSKNSRRGWAIAGLVVGGLLLIGVLSLALLGAYFEGAINPSQVDQEAFAHFNRGTEYLANGDFVQAISEFDNAIEIDPQYTIAYNERGVVYFEMGEFDRAIADFDRAIEIAPQYLLAYSNRGASYFEMGELDRAIIDYDRAIEIDSQFAMAYLNRGNAYNKMGEFDRAITDYDRAIEIDPEDAGFYWERGAAYAYKGDYDKAVADFDKIITLNPNYAIAYYRRGSYLSEIGEKQRAISDLEKALELGLPTEAQEMAEELLDELSQ